MTAKATIIVPLLRQVDAWLHRAVESAVNQTVPCEVLVVTSPKTPESNRLVLEQILLRHANLRVIEREPHMRFPGALNLGIRSASYERLGLLFTDDWLDPRTVEKCLELDADIVSTSQRFFAADGVTVLAEIKGTHNQAEYGALLRQADRAKYLKHFFLFRRAALLAVGGTDETLGDSPGVDDFDLIWCLLDNGASVSIVEDKLYCIRDHSGERLTTRNKEEMIATFGRILDKHNVAGKERKTMMEKHSPWFGKPILTVYRELFGTPIPGELNSAGHIKKRS